MPNPGDRLLDTSIVVDYLRGVLGRKEQMEAIPARFLSVIALGELYLGAEASANPQGSIKSVDAFAANCALIDCNRETAREFGRLKCPRDESVS